MVVLLRWCWLSPPPWFGVDEGVESRLYTAESRKGYFYYDYEVQPNGQPKRHLLTIFAVLGEQEVLVTFTAQCLEEYFLTFKPTFEAIANSFTIIKA